MRDESRRILRFAVVYPLLAVSGSLIAQTAEKGTLAGTVSDGSGHVVANVTVTVTSQDAGQLRNRATGTVGTYRFDQLPEGTYSVRFEAAGFKPIQIRDVRVKRAETTVLDEKLGAGEQINSEPTPEGQESLPNAPSSTNGPSLQDLGFPPDQTQGNAKEQALLDKRTHMLKIHQRMGLITAIPLLATLATSVNAGGKSTSTTDRDVHLALGAVTGDLYFITAYYAIRAPRVPGTETRGPIRVHKALAWIHGPGMVLTPILGALAYNQKSNGEKVHGIASAHAPVAIVTAGAFGAALVAVSFKF